jgi:hypothetical protein
MTEKEAITKWCPMARVRASGDVEEAPAVNRTLKRSFVLAECIASECMMWRKDAKYGDSYYCGLGGKP